VVDAGKNSILGLEGVAGFHIIAIKWEEKVPEIVEGAGLYPNREMIILELFFIKICQIPYSILIPAISTHLRFAADTSGFRENLSEKQPRAYNSFHP